MKALFVGEGGSLAVVLGLAHFTVHFCFYEKMSAAKGGLRQIPALVL